LFEKPRQRRELLPVDEGQVIGGADSVGLATAIFADFELDDL